VPRAFKERVKCLLPNRNRDGALMAGQAMGTTAGVVLQTTIVGLLAALGPARQGLKIDSTEALQDRSR
jgi:hypothetical protein